MFDKYRGEEQNPQKSDRVGRRLRTVTNANMIHPAAIFACAMTMTGGDPPEAVGAWIHVHGTFSRGSS